MGRYSIKDIEVLSGVKAHTLRIWEQRYDLIKPHRTPTNIRFYTDDQLRYLMNVSYLIDHGWKISKISELSQETVGEQVLELDEKRFDEHGKIKELTKAMITLDEPYFDKLFADALLHLDPERTFIEVIVPFLQKIGVLWSSGTIKPSHEHFVSNLIRQKLITAIDGLSSKKTTATKRFFLFLPEGELHEFSLLLAHYMLKRRGHEVIYIGASVPFEDLKVMIADTEPDYLFSVFTLRPLKGAESFIADLLNAFPDSKTLISGHAALQELPSGKNYTVFKDFDETVQFIDNLT